MKSGSNGKAGNWGTQVVISRKVTFPAYRSRGVVKTDTGERGEQLNNFKVYIITNESVPRSCGPHVSSRIFQQAVTSAQTKSHHRSVRHRALCCVWSMRMCCAVLSHSCGAHSASSIFQETIIWQSNANARIGQASRALWKEGKTGLSRAVALVGGAGGP